MRKEKKTVKGAARIAEHINQRVIPNIPGKVSEDTIRRELIKNECGSGGLVSEPREDKKTPFETAQSSLDALHDPCNVWDFENIAIFCCRSVRWVKEQAKNDPRFPIYRLFGRVYSTQSSLADYMVKHSEKSEKWKLSSREKEKFTDVTGGSNL